MFHDSRLPGQPRPAASLKDAMRRFVGAVSVITSGEPGERTGATVTTAQSLSVDPETMLVSVNRASSTWAVIQRTGAFCVNLVAADRLDVAERFSGFKGHAGEARYEGADWARLATGAAVLSDALAAIDCRVERVVHHHSHVLVFGHVEAVLLGQDRAALVYAHGRYDRVSSPAEPAEVL